MGCIGTFYASLGKNSEALEIIKRLKLLSRKRDVSSFVLAWIYANLHGREKALEHLEQTCAERSSYLSVIEVEPAMDYLRSDPRFINLPRCAGLSL